MNRIEKHAKNTFIILMLIMLFWIFMSFIFQKLLFPPSKNNLTTYEALKYYTHLKGYYGLDHISKGIAYIACVLIPFNFFFRFNDIKKDNNYNNIISTLFLLLYFLVNGISLIIQGFTAEFTISLISESNIHNNHEFAVNLFRYVIFFIKRTKTSCQMFTINYILFKININPTIFTFNTFGHISNSICTNLIYFYRFSKFCRVNFSLFMY